MTLYDFTKLREFFLSLEFEGNVLIETKELNILNSTYCFAAGMFYDGAIEMVEQNINTPEPFHKYI